MISIIVAVGKNGEIGKDNKLLWHLPDDLKFFKRITTGHPVLMGRNTFESIGRPLPNRRNIIITRNINYAAEGIEVANSINAALTLTTDSEDIMIVGGADIYKQILPQTDRVYLTVVNAEPEADKFFEQLKPSQWKLVEETHHAVDEKHAYSFDMQVWERV